MFIKSYMYWSKVLHVGIYQCLYIDVSPFSFRTLLDSVTPILEKETTLEAFKALPKVNAILKAVEDFANKTDLKEIGE